MGTRVIIGSTTLISFILAGMLFYQQSTRETLKGLGWELVADQGTVKFVYVNPIRCADEQFMAGVLFEILGDPYENDLPLVEIYFFDDLEYTPTGLPISREKLEENEYPFSDGQLRHFRAVYTFNQSDGDNFCFVDFTNSYATPPEFTLRRADIYPRLATN